MLIDFKPLPNTVRENLLQNGSSHLALVLDVALFTGMSGEFTVYDLIERARGFGLLISEKVIRKGLADAIWRPHVRREGRVGKAGRPSVVYTVPHRSDLVRWYGGGQELACDDLVARDFDSIAAYRSGLHREFIRRAPGSYSRAFLGRRLGVSKNATRYYEREGTIQVSRDFQWEWLSNPDTIPVGGVRNSSFLLVVEDSERPDLQQLEILGPKMRWADFDAQDLPGKRLPLVRYLAWHYWRIAGFSVYVVRQKPNYYSVNEMKYQQMYGRL